MFEWVPGADGDWMAAGVIGVWAVILAFVIAAALGGPIALATAPGAVVTVVAALVLGLRQPVDDEGVGV